MAFNKKLYLPMRLGNNGWLFPHGNNYIMTVSNAFFIKKTTKNQKKPWTLNVRILIVKDKFRDFFFHSNEKKKI